MGRKGTEGSNSTTLFHLLILFLFFTLLFISTTLSLDTITEFSSSSSSCSGYSTCTSCAASSGAGLGCSWCPIDNTCHNYGSILNDCQFYENIHNASLCGCSPSTCIPTGLTPPSGCSWYVNGTSEPGDDPSLWEGGDFLLATYGHAAECACSGDGNPLWNGAAANCVRTYLLEGHKSLSNETKWAMRNATLSEDPYTQWQPFIPSIFHMHQDAYAHCCCPGEIAPYVFWLGIFYAGNLLPCAGVDAAVLSQSRCGCGF